MFTWNDIVESQRGNKASPIDPAIVDRALDHLRSVFGDDAMALPPLVLERLLSATRDAQAWFVWLSDSLRRLEGMEGYLSLVQRLTDRDRFIEGWSVLEIGERLSSAGLGITFDALLTVGTAKKMPDIAFTERGTNTTFTCEVSIQFSAKSHERSSELTNQIFWMLVGDPDDRLAYAARVLPTAPDRDMGGLLNAVFWEIMEARRDRRFRAVTVDNAVELALAPRDEAASVREWAEARGQALDSICGLPPVIDQARRLREKIEDKAKQLARDGPNLLVIWAQDFFIGTDTLDLVQVIRETIAAWPSISVLVLVADGAALGLGPDHEIDGIRVTTSRRGGDERRFLITVNRMATNPFPIGTLNKLLAAFSL